MNYGLAAGALVTLSLLLLALEPSPPNAHARGSGFLLLYGLGVCCWLMLGIVMNEIALVIISALQLFFLSIYAVRART